MKSYWIWNYGDFEIYHSNLSSGRREDRESYCPPVWSLSSVEQNVVFRRKFKAEKKGYMLFYATGIGTLNIDGKNYPQGKRIEVDPGEHEARITVFNMKGLPSAYVEGDICTTDKEWYVSGSRYGTKYNKVGYDEKYDNPDITPETFMFEYERLKPVKTEKTNGGFLFDFGKELFGYVYIKNVKKEEEIHVIYGESQEEALDEDNAVLLEKVCGKEEYKLKQRAFRYIFVSGCKSVEVEADYEYLPLEYKGSFRCNDEELNKLWDVCAYTLHLNCREVIFDGIKRDRWVWGGDAYQAYKCSNYVFFDKEIVRRSIVALRGKDPIIEYINTIIDFSMYWVISLWDYYMNFGDKEFIEYIYPKAQSLMEYAKNRVNEDGFLTGRDEDWTFIDWHDIDKTGAVCAEQMLFIEAYKTMAKIAKEINMPYKAYQNEALELTQKVNKFFWSDEKCAYIDSYESGKNHVTRHANIFAVMYDIANEEQKSKIIENVILNDDISKIITPFFEGFELDVMGKIGNFDYIENMINSYWKGMLKLGATTIWEEFDPELTGIEHYAKYGLKFGKSLCHAWGAIPIYLLGKYYLGVYPTSPGYDTFEIKPYLGSFERIEGVVPINGGEVCVYLSKDELIVKATKNGGWLIWDNMQYKIEAGKEFKISF